MVRAAQYEISKKYHKEKYKQNRENLGAKARKPSIHTSRLGFWPPSGDKSIAKVTKREKSEISRDRWRRGERNPNQTFKQVGETIDDAKNCSVSWFSFFSFDVWLS